MAISWIVFAGVFGGSLIGMLLARILHEDYLSSDVIKLVMDLIATMSALVLALLISSAKASYDIQRSEVGQLAAGFAPTACCPTMDRRLQTPAAQLRNTLAGAVDQIWSGNTYQAQKATRARSDEFADRIRQLEPHNEFQRSLYAQAMQIGAQLGQTYALLLGQTGGSIPMPFLVVLIFWLAMLFTSFGYTRPTTPPSLEPCWSGLCQLLARFF